MKAARLWIVLAGAILFGSSLGATAARADGLPVLGVDVGATGVVDAVRPGALRDYPGGRRHRCRARRRSGRPHWRFAALAWDVHDSRGCL